MHTLSYIIGFTCFFTNNIYYFPTYIYSSGGKEDATADGHSYHDYTYMIVFSLITCTIFPLIYVAKERKKTAIAIMHTLI